VNPSNPSGTRPASVPRDIGVELLALDLTACTRCVGSLASIEAAVAALRPVLEATGARVTVSQRIVESEEEARRLRFVSSPTIRVNGRDIAPEVLETPCQSCTDLCGCAGGTSCRVWRYQGGEYQEAPAGLIMEAVLREVLADDRPDRPAADGREVPDNLRRFFRGKAAQAPASTCCSTAERATCCDADQKEGCCDDSQPATCGCR
jgi:hypothetical protein